MTGWWQFPVEDDEDARKTMRRLRRATDELNRIRRNAQAEIEEVQRKALDDEGSLADEIRARENALADYHRRILEANPKAKTYKLPGGNLTHRVGSKSVKVTDEPAFVEWALVNAPRALAYKPQVSVLNPAHGFVRTEDGTIVAAGGEVVPGVVEVRGEDRYSVDLNTEATA